MGLYNIMRSARAKYRYAVRSVKRDKDEIITKRFAEVLLSDNERDFEGEVKMLRGRPNYSFCSNVIDDCYTDADIDPYTSVSFNVNDIEEICWSYYRW